MAMKILLLLFKNMCIHLVGSPLVFSLFDFTFQFALNYITTATLKTFSILIQMY